MTDLEQRLRRASAAYYNEGPIMEDAEFDALVEELRQEDPDNAFLKEIGAPAPESSPLTKVRHAMDMGSLDKVSIAEFPAWAAKTGSQALMMTDKLDGSSLELLYSKGVFRQAITRGDGIVGEDVTHTIKKSGAVPMKISEQGQVSVRCEAVIPVAVWKAHLSKTTENPRNAAAGIVRRLDGEGAQYLDCVAFDAVLLDSHVSPNGFDYELEKLVWLHEQGFTVVASGLVEPCMVLKTFAKWEADRDKHEFECDGVVVKVNATALQSQLGEKDMRPRYAKAIKFAPQGGDTNLVDVIFTVGSQGAITPVAKVDPVRVAGVTITSASLANMDEVARLGLAIGDVVRVERAGDVIPQIVKVVKKSGLVKPTVDKCPACGSALVKTGAITFCSKPAECPGVRFAKIQGWITKRNIMHLGDESLKKLWDAQIVREIVRLYTMEVSDMATAGIGSAMAWKIKAEIEKSRTVSFADFIGSMSLPMLGRRQAKKLLATGLVHDMRSLYTLDWKALAQYSGFGEIKSKAIVNGIRNSIAELTELAQYMIFTEEEKPKAVATSGPLGGRSFCFTGKSSLPRKDLWELVQKNGGVVHESVTKATNVLVLASLDSTSSKAEKARRNGTVLMAEANFLKLTVGVDREEIL